jgi:hypothetical protein
MNIVQNRMKAERDLRRAQKTLRNFEIVSKSLSSEIAQLHAPGLKTARANLEMAKKRVARAQELVRIQIRLLKAKAAKKRYALNNLV